MSELEQNTGIDPSIPTGEVVSPELAVREVSETPAAPETNEEAQEREELAAAGLEVGTPAAHKWAELRREGRDAKRVAREAELEIARWKGRAEALAEKGQVAAPVTAQPMPSDPMAEFALPRPQEDDFETFGEYEAAKDDWLVAKAEHRATQKILRENAHTQASSDIAGWLNQAPADLADFEAVVRRPVEEGGPPLSNEMVEICRTSPVGHQLLYQLAENPKEVARLRSMPPHLMALEIARREAKLSVSPAQPKKISSAPNPIRPVSTGSVINEAPLEKLDWAEFENRRNRELYGPDWKG